MLAMIYFQVVIFGALAIASISDGSPIPQNVITNRDVVSTGNPLLDLFFLPEIIGFNIIHRIKGNGR